MADLRSAEVTSAPRDFEDFKSWTEQTFRDHFEDLKQLKEMIDMQNGFRFRKDSGGDMIIEEYIISTETWTETGWKLKTMQ